MPLQFNCGWLQMLVFLRYAASAFALRASVDRRVPKRTLRCSKIQHFRLVITKLQVHHNYGIMFIYECDTLELLF